MDEFKALIIILISSVLVNNYVLNKFWGVCPFLGVSKKIDQAAGMGVAVIIVMLVATAVTWPIETYLLDRFNLSHMQTVVFILVIASVVQMLELLLKRLVPSLYRGLGVYLPLITTNCAVLGITQDNVNVNNYNFLYSIVNSLGCGIGFLLAMILFAGMRSLIDETKIPKPFRGIAITLIAASFLSLAFMGFSGVVPQGGTI